MAEQGQRRWTKHALVAIGFAVSAIFTYLAVRDVRVREVWDGLRSSNYWWTIPTVALVAASLIVRAARWQYLFARESRPPLRPVVAATILGQFFNNVLPARAGEAARIIALNQSAGTSRAETAATVVVERAYDVLSLLVMLFVLVPWLPHVRWLHAAAILAVALTVGLVAAVVVLDRYGDRPFRYLMRPLAWLPFLSIERTERAAESLVRGAAALRQWRLVAVALTLTIVSWILLGFSCWTLMLGFDLHLGILAGMLVIVALGLAAVLPSSPAAVGVFETAALLALNAYGIPDSGALSYALVLHAVNFFPYIVAGAFVLHSHTRALRRRAAAAG